MSHGFCTLRNLAALVCGGVRDCGTRRVVTAERNLALELLVERAMQVRLRELVLTIVARKGFIRNVRLN